MITYETLKGNRALHVHPSTIEHLLLCSYALVVFSKLEQLLGPILAQHRLKGDISPAEGLCRFRPIFLWCHCPFLIELLFLYVNISTFDFLKLLNYFNYGFICLIVCFVHCVGILFSLLFSFVLLLESVDLSLLVTVELIHFV